jgi:hypothetical protein
MRIILTAFTAILALAASTAWAQALYEEGVHYQVLAKEVPTQDPTKIEVTEVFWYGCGHCYTFESLVHHGRKNNLKTSTLCSRPPSGMVPWSYTPRLTIPPRP